MRILKIEITVSGNSFFNSEIKTSDVHGRGYQQDARRTPCKIYKINNI